MPNAHKDFPNYEEALLKTDVQAGHDTARMLEEIAAKRDLEINRAHISDWVMGVAPDYE